jgi:hypothetical protein
MSEEEAPGTSGNGEVEPEGDAPAPADGHVTFADPPPEKDAAKELMDKLLGEAKADGNVSVTTADIEVLMSAFRKALDVSRKADHQRVESGMKEQLKKEGAYDSGVSNFFISNFSSEQSQQQAVGGKAMVSGLFGAGGARQALGKAAGFLSSRGLIKQALNKGMAAGALGSAAAARAGVAKAAQPPSEMDRNRRRTLERLFPTELVGQQCASLHGLLAQVSTWDFDLLELQKLAGDVTMVLTVQACLQSHNLITNLDLDEKGLRAFLKEMSGSYLKLPYHNDLHCSDVTQTMCALLSSCGLGSIYSKNTVLAVLLAACIHDVGHGGLSNNYLKVTEDDLALRYGNKSPLENMHCSLLYEILKKPDMDIFAGLDDVQWRESRKVILSLILGTDMAHHFDQVSKTQLFLEVHGEDVKSFYRGAQESIECFQDDKNRIFIMELFLHCSDISNPFKPFHICAQWADLVSQEFFSQGDKERSNGMDISPMMDRATSNLFNMQMGFIEFVVSPLINSTITIFPPLKEMGNFMRDNYVEWGEKRKTEIMETDNGSSDDAKALDASKMTERITKFKEKMAFVDELHDPKRKFSSSSLVSKRSS